MQVERFEPVSVTVEETIEVRDDEEAVIKARRKLYSDVTKQVASYIDNEKRKYKKDSEDK